MRFLRTSIASQFVMNWRISAFSISLIFNESWSRELWIMNYEVWIMRYECGVKSWSWNILLLEKILHYATLRSEWQGSIFCSRLGIYIIGGIFLNRKDFFSWIAFLSELSENSLANWESYVLNILLYLSNNKVIVTDYKSATSVFFKWAKLAKFIRFEALWELLFKQAYFLSQSSRRAGEMIAFLRALRNIGTQSLESLRSNVCFLVKI